MKTLRTEFEALKSELFDGNTYDSSGNDSYPWIEKLLDNLEAKIFEYENRMVCAIKTSDDIRKAIQKYTTKVDDGESFVMSVDDHDVILRGANEIDIALDINDNTVVTDDWYGLFIGRKNKEVLYSFVSSWGEIDCNKDGYVVDIRGDKEINGEHNYLYDIDRINLSEYGQFLVRNNITSGECDDILAVGYFTKDGKYTKPDTKWREGIFGKAEERPTVLCKDDGVNNIVATIIDKLKEINVDGETMQYILQQVGMEGQMLSQLVKSCEHLEQVEELIQEAKELSK